MNDVFIYTAKSPEIRHLISNDSKLAPVIHRIGNLEYSIDKDSFAFLVNTIIGQMLSNRIADIISQRLVNQCGGQIKPHAIKMLGIPGVKAIGISQRKAECICLLTEKYLKAPSFFDRLTQASDKEVISELTSLRGIGAWSAKMYLIFVLNRLDVLPYEDGAFLQAYKWLYDTKAPTRNHIIEQCRIWQPYSSLAARYLYKLLDGGYTTKGPYNEQALLQFHKT